MKNGKRTAIPLFCIGLLLAVATVAAAASLPERATSVPGNGDLDGNSEIEKNDLDLLRGLLTGSDISYSEAGDLNGNGRIDSNDYTRLRDAYITEQERHIILPEV